MNRTITVKGMGRVLAKPNYVVLSLTTKAKDLDYDKAMDLATTQLSQLSESFKEIGFKKEDLKTTSFNVDMAYDGSQDKFGNYKQVFSGFVCQHFLKISFDFEMKRLSEVLSTISKSAAKPEISVSFTVKDTVALKEDLLRDASKNALRKATVLCEATGVQLGQLVTIDYNWRERDVFSNTQYAYREFQMDDQASPMAKTIDIEPDDIDISDNVTFVWEII